jgi:heme oxygenase
MPMSTVQSLRDITRQRTAAAHAALEATPLMREIASGAPSDTDYCDYLARQWSMHAPLEAALRPWVSQPWRNVRLVKTRWLTADILAMGAAPPIAGSGCAAITSEAQALGTLYVLEGGTLGLQIVRKRLRSHGNHRDTASRFLRGYGDATAAHWREFVERLEALPSEVWPLALDAACATFAAFHRRFAGRLLSAGFSGPGLLADAREHGVP